MKSLHFLDLRVKPEDDKFYHPLSFPRKRKSRTNEVLAFPGSPVGPEDDRGGRERPQDDKKYNPQMTIEKQVSKTIRRLSNTKTGPKNSALLSFSARVIPFIRRQT